MQIPCESIKGFNELSEQQQSIFRNTYNRHYQIMGTSMREAMISVSVKVAGKPGKRYLKVMFNTGEWYHYFPGGVYY